MTTHMVHISNVLNRHNSVWRSRENRFMDLSWNVSELHASGYVVCTPTSYEWGPGLESHVGDNAIHTVVSCKQTLE